jgi:hypothetical protein
MDRLNVVPNPQQIPSRMAYDLGGAKEMSNWICLTARFNKASGSRLPRILSLQLLGKNSLKELAIDAPDAANCIVAWSTGYWSWIVPRWMSFPSLGHHKTDEG